MITNQGKEIISRYLLSQVPSYATHIAVGCGAVPLDGNDVAPSTITLLEKEILDFEMFRVPITSKGFVNQEYNFDITNRALTSNIVTLTTSVAHNISIGDSVIVSQIGSYNITNKQLTSNVAILTTSVNHDIKVNDIVTISNVDATFNGQYTVTVVSSNTFRYAKTATNVGSTATTGAVTNSTFNGTYSVSGIPTSTTFNYSATASNIASTATTGNVNVSKTKVSLTAELPTSERYEISEIGVWSAPSNTLAINFDSRVIFDFSESWKGHGTSIYDPVINTNVGNNTVDIEDNGNKIFYALTSDPLFQNSVRKARKEGARYLTTTLLMRGNTSTITGSSGSWVGSGEHIHLNGISFDISRNSANDILKLAFSLVDKTEIAEALPNNVKILIEFYKNEDERTATGYATAEIQIAGTEFSTSRYHVVDIPISDLITSAGFSAPTIRVCRIFTQITSAGMSPSTNHYLAFDAFRIENVTTTNPLYKLSGYSVVRTDTGDPIIKNQNTNNYVDFRFNLGIV